MSDLAGKIIKHAIYPLWVRKNGSAQLRYAAALERSQWWSRSRLREHQTVALQRLVRHAYASCPHYRDAMKAACVLPADIRSVDDVSLLPVLSKQDIQENRERIVSTAAPRGTLLTDQTGGSTGSPLTFHYDPDRRDHRDAAAIRHDRWAGLDIGDRLAVLWGSSRDTLSATANLKAKLRGKMILRRHTLNLTSLDESDLAVYAKHLTRYQPRTILGYANSLALFARYVKAEGITSIRPHSVISTAEVLTPAIRDVLTDAFECDVFNRYGSRETSVIASDCSYHDGLHINAENLIVEAGEGGADEEILVTELNNFAMPLIRYRIGDKGRLLKGMCRCGRGLPLLDLAGGRVSDYLRATNGKLVNGLMLATYAITHIKGVRQVQIVQKTPLEVFLRVVRGPGWSLQSADALTRNVCRFLGAEMGVLFEFPDYIPPTASGKFRFSISELPQVSR